MTWWEILLLVGVCVAFVAALGAGIYNKLKGKTGCDCCGSGKTSGGCDGRCAHCHAHNATKRTSPERKKQPRRDR